MITQNFLDTLINVEAKLDRASNRDFQLDRMFVLLDKLGNPQNKLKIVQVAGTKGKGSVCIFLAEICRAAGYKTGLYTSPHFNDINERIRILDLPRSENIFDGMISDLVLDNLIQQHRHILEEMHESSYGRLTFFEALTALALCYFVEQNTDIVILETGLGGRLDATNTAHALVCAITPISLEHTHILGSTLAAIAREKAGIIKNNDQHVVVGVQQKEALDVIEKHCSSLGVVPILNQHQHNLYKEVPLGLKGPHQQSNAITAVSIAETLQEHGFHFSEDHIKTGLSEARWPGRFEVLSYQGATFVLDGAHNQASLQVLDETLKETFPDHKRLMILGVSLDKDVEAIVSQVYSMTDLLFLTRANHPRAFDFTAYRGRAGQRDWTKTANLGQAMGIAVEHYAEHVIVVTGSLFLVAEARRLLVK